MKPSRCWAASVHPLFSNPWKTGRLAANSRHSLRMWGVWRQWRNPVRAVYWGGGCPQRFQKATSLASARCARFIVAPLA